MKKMLLVLLTVTICFSIFANGFNLNTVGARAFGMGGAMVGLADDPTAFYWNPAGLASQGNHIQLGVHDIIPTLTYENQAAMIDAETEANHYPPPFAFWNHKLNEQMAIGLGLCVPSAIGAEWDGANLTNLNLPALNKVFDWESQVMVAHFGPSIAYQATDKLSLGATAEVSYGIMELHMGDDMDMDGLIDTQYNEESTGTGFGVNLGLKYDFSNEFSIGATYRSPVHFAFTQDDVELIAPNGTGGYTTMNAEMTRYVTWPMMLGFGTAIKVKPFWTLSADVQYTEWSIMDELKTELDFDSTLNGAGIDDRVKHTHMDWVDATQYRIGNEFAVHNMWDLRLGYYYDPSPAPNETINILFPSHTYHAVTTGFGFHNDVLAADFGFEYLFGNERDAVMEYGAEMPGTYQMDIMSIALSLTYKY